MLEGILGDPLIGPQDDESHSPLGPLYVRRKNSREESKLQRFIHAMIFLLSMQFIDLFTQYIYIFIIKFNDLFPRCEKKIKRAAVRETSDHSLKSLEHHSTMASKVLID